MLDEPLAGLNYAEAGRFADLIVELNRDGITIVLVEHNLGEVTRIARRLLVLHNGAVLAHGDPRSVMARSDVRDAYLGAEAHA
jgi:branched-chain amino acid transport system ATP-binding protein